MGKESRRDHSRSHHTATVTPYPRILIDHAVASGLAVDREEQALWQRANFRSVDMARASEATLLAIMQERIEEYIDILASSKVRQYRDTAYSLVGKINSRSLRLTTHSGGAQSGYHLLMTLYPEAHAGQIEWWFSFLKTSIFGRFGLAGPSFHHENFHHDRFVAFMDRLPAFLTAEEKVAEFLNWSKNPRVFLEEEVLAHTESTKAYIQLFGRGVVMPVLNDDAVMFVKQGCQITPAWRAYIGARYQLHG